MGKKKTKTNKSSPKPTGLGISRSRNTFTFTWKGAYAEGTKVAIYYRSGGWYKVTVVNGGKSATSKAHSVPYGSWYPSTNSFITGVGFYVKGTYKDTDKINYSESKWSDAKTIALYPPSEPTVTVTRESTYNNTFTIDVPNHINDRNWWSTHVEYCTCLRLNCDDVDGANIPEASWGYLNRQAIYNNITQSDKTNFPIQIIESDTAAIAASSSAVRWFRARVVGPSGVSGWIYSNIAYSEPYPAEITRSVVTETNRGACHCTVSWNYTDSVSHPIDTMAVRYAFVVPGGIYGDYRLTSDSDIQPGKTYYTAEGTLVPYEDVRIENIWKYYVKTGNTYRCNPKSYYVPSEQPNRATWHNGNGWYLQINKRSYMEAFGTELDNRNTYYKYKCQILPGKNYYKAERVPSGEVRQEDADTYYTGTYANVLIDDLHQSWRRGLISRETYEYIQRWIRRGKEKRSLKKFRTSVLSGYARASWTGQGSKYYVIEAVEYPDEAQANNYLIKTGNWHYEKAKAENFSAKNKYYVMDFTPVQNPVKANLKSYYEEFAVNYLEPTSDFSWNDAEIGGNNTIAVARPTWGLTTHQASVPFTINEGIPKDQLLFVSVRTTYNSINIDSKYFQCTNANGEIPNRDTFLAPPDNPVPTWGTDVLNVVTKNNSEVYGSKIAIVFIPENPAESSEIIGIAVPDSEGEVDVNVEVPPKYLDPQTAEGFGIGVFAFAGTHILSRRVTSGSHGYNVFTVNALIRSEMITYGGEIPRPPSDVEVSHLGDGNVLVTWKWTWKGADCAEIAWSDYSEALDSNSQPSMYEVPSYKHSRLIVRDLELGKIWYFWARLKKEENASMWTVPVYTSLSSSPNVPILELSKRYITLDDKIVANWSYVTTDGTPQQSAVICMCTIDAEEVTYGDPIASVPTELITNPETQSVVLDPNSDELSWSEGEDYYLAVKVTSGSGMISEWSPYVPISVIAPIDFSLVSSSLTPEIFEYSEEETYQVGDYVIYRVSDSDDPNKEYGKIYKCISEISTPEYWDETHWIVDPECSHFQMNEFPLTVQIDAEGSNDIETAIIIERAMDYSVDRPDGKEYGGHEGDVVAQIKDLNGNSFIINQQDINGYLDDGAFYYLTIRISDNYGQFHEVKYDFVVNWSHQAMIPVATMEIDNTYNVAKIHVIRPSAQYMLTIDTEIIEGKNYYEQTGTGTVEDPYVYSEVVDPTGNPAENSWYEYVDQVVEGDSCDIYRMSADGLELIYPNAEFGETYVDPYPTIGDHGGYRVVYKTVNGDYITPNNGFAWIDFDEEENMLYSISHLIDFDNETINLMYNVDVDNSWSKDFQETHYLGGSIVGDWNSGVSKTTSMSSNVVTSDWDIISALRRLANYTGECHVRTLDGSNFIANVEVSERAPYESYTDPNMDYVKVYEYSLSITRIDPISYDGMTLRDWEESL